VVTNALIVADIQRSVGIYRDVLGAVVLRGGEPTYCGPAMFGSLSIAVGGPTDDKPELFASPPRDPNVLAIFLDLRVTDISRYYDLWSSGEAKFILKTVVRALPLICFRMPMHLQYPAGTNRHELSCHDDRHLEIGAVSDRYVAGAGFLERGDQSSRSRLVPALDCYGLKFTEVESVPTGRVN
jgi:hypothetical protein